MKKPFTVGNHLINGSIDGKPISDAIRETVLDGIFFFDEEDRKKNPILEYSIVELAGKIWMRSYTEFSEELNKIITYFNYRCDELGIVPTPCDSFQSHFNQLINMKSLDEHQFLILNGIDERDLEQITHEFKLRLQFDDLNTYIISRNLVYLTFISILKYSRSIEEEYIYLLIILTFLILYYIEVNFTYFKGSTDTIDYSVYEIVRILSKERKMKFNSLVSDSVKKYDKAQVHLAIGKLIQILLDDSVDESIDRTALEDNVDSILSTLVSVKSPETISYDHRQRTQIMMIALDMDKTKHKSILEKQTTLEFIDNVLSSKTTPDKYKSDYRISSQSSQTINILIEGKSCRNKWLQENANKHELLYHLHHIGKSMNRCSISVELPTMTYFAIIPQLQIAETKASIRLSNYKNSISNLVNLSEPGIDAPQFSPKLGISKPRNKPQLIVNSEKNIFKHSPSFGIELLKPEGIINSFNRSINSQSTDRTNADPIEDYDLLKKMESLLQAGCISAYEFEVFEDEIILFMSMDFDQQEELFSKRINEETKDQMREVVKAANVSIALLIDR